MRWLMSGGEAVKNLLDQGKSKYYSRITMWPGKVRGY